MVAQSTTEAEYIATAAVVNQAVWLRKILSGIKKTDLCNCNVL